MSSSRERETDRETSETERAFNCRSYPCHDSMRVAAPASEPETSSVGGLVEYDDPDRTGAQQLAEGSTRPAELTDAAYWDRNWDHVVLPKSIGERRARSI
jgi:hypothetical protein